MIQCATTPAGGTPASCGLLPTTPARRARRQARIACLLAVVSLAPVAWGQSILREVWEGIPGVTVADLTSSPDYPSRPSFTNYINDFFEAPTDVLENYGQRLHGYLLPPVTGNYTFWIASDDGGELWLSTDASPSNQRLIATVASWTSPREWTKEANQQSAPVRLTAGQPYYVAALQKEGGGGDNLAVRWLRPDGVDEGPIPARYLLPFGVVFGPPVIAVQPTNTTVIEGRLATFTVQPGGVGPVAYQWQRNGTNLPGATASQLQFGPVKLTDHGSQFRVVLTNTAGAATSESAVLSVRPDTEPPRLANVRNEGRTRVLVVFDERVAAASALNPANYALDRGRNVTAAAFGADQQSVLLTVSPLTYGETYALTVNNVTDLAATPNAIAPNSRLSFTGNEFVPADIGSPALAGSTVSVPGGVDVTGGGRTIGGTSDQFHFGWQETIGDFDLEARVEDVTVPDPFVHAGLMARASLDANATFGAVFASSVQLGCFFEARTTAGATTTTAAPRGGFPANFPHTWLRLQRSGTTLLGYASLDGQTWVQLGSATIAGLPARLYVGFAVCGDNEAATATARFRDRGPVRHPSTGSVAFTKEPAGPSSRATGMIISEIMYDPPPRADGRNLEFIELHNARSVPEDLSGWRLSAEISYRFPDGFILPAGGTVVVAAAPEDVRAAYGITNALGPYSGALSNGGGIVRLRNNADAIRLEVEYDDAPPWPVAAADGAGHSLVLARPSYGEADVRAWTASEFRGGSPGTLDPTVPAPETSVVINEFLAHTDDPVLDFVELYNRSNQRVDLSGCWLSDLATTNRFRIPDGTVIEPRGFMSWDQNQLGFALSSAGEAIYLVNSNQTRVLDAIKFGGQENGVSFGRAPDGSPTRRRLFAPTPGAANAPWRQEDIVINELMYNPISGDDDDEYVELCNRSAQPISLAGWQFVAGIEFTLPPNTTLAPGGHLVVAKNAARLRANHPHLTTANTVGDYSGVLSNRGERVALARPDEIVTMDENGQLQTNVIQIVVAEVTYADGGRWGEYADGGGSSLELIDPNGDPWRAANWADSDETAKAPWTTVEFTGRVDNANGSANRLFIGSLGGGEYLVDDVEVLRVGSTNVVNNGGFESGTTGWLFSGNHSLSSVVTGGAASGAACLRLRGQGDGDTGPNTVRNTLRATIAANAAATIRAKVRWLAGWPQVLFRLKGNGLELAANLEVPRNLGTPGLPNSRRVLNAGPAIFDVTHSPALPAASEAVLVTCRVSDAAGVRDVRLQYRLDPATTLTTVILRDDGTSGDERAGDGVYSGRIPGQAAGRLVAFRISATDDASLPATSVFPAAAPARECLIRWGDPVPFGTFAHYHLWFTQATQNARQNALDNTYRDCTVVYNNHRVIYNAGFRDKGSPYHGGAGDLAVQVPADELLLGEPERILGSTGNGGSEATAIRSQLAAWYAQQLGIPYLHAHYIRVYFNGSEFRNVVEDLEQPRHEYARRWFQSAPEGDLYKVSVWFEFDDDNRGFQPTGATLQRFTTLNNEDKLARYRWNWQRRSNDGDASNYGQLLDLVTVMNDTSAAYTTRALQLADLEQWMRVFCYDYAMGNWDAWTYNVGQNMFIYKPDGQRWVLMPWDIDFVFGLGDGTSGPLRGGGQDPTMSRAYSNPAFLRMNWRAYQDTINGPFLPERFQPQIDARRSVLLKNGITGLSDPRVITSWINSRRTVIANQLNNADAKVFEITTNGGQDFDATTPTVTLDGTAPFAVATLEVNGIPYPVTWTTARNFRIVVPLTAATNTLNLVGRDLRGNLVPGATDSITVRYSGAIEKVEDFVVINEVHYDAADLEPGSTFIELHNRSTATPFDLSGFVLNGVGYTFPAGALIQPGAHLVLAGNRAGFSAVYGSTIPVFDQFPGSLDNDGERLALVKPATATTPEQIVSDLRYWHRLPWPTNAAGLGPSLQLVDPAQGAWRVANWAATATDDVNRATPGRANAGRQNLAPFPPLWLNEVQPNNVAGPVDGAGDRDPWIELYNAGTETLDLSPYYLTDSYTALTRWQFPAGTTLAPGGFLVVWADGEPAETRPGELHTNFRLAPATGAVALVRQQGTPLTPAVMDFIEWENLSTGRSVGSYPDGEPRRRRQLVNVTPGGKNDPALPPIFVRINEFMAGNTRTIADPADNDFDDWFELYNPAAAAADLSGYTLTDTFANPTKYTIPSGTVIPPGGFLLAWADEETAQNVPGRDLHVNFRLALAGESLALFAPDGSLVDGFTFGPQVNDVSQGRYPDGAELPLYDMETPTPGFANVLAGANRPPVFDPIAPLAVNEETPLTFVARATDPDEGQTVRYHLGPDAPPGAVIDPDTGAFRWTPEEAEGPGLFSFLIRATDNGTPARTGSVRVNVTVAEVNRPPGFVSLPEQLVDEGELLAVQFVATDPDLPPNRLTFTLGPDAPADATLTPEGAFSWVPDESRGGSIVSFSVRVTDDGTPPLSDSGVVRIRVHEVPNPPIMPFIEPQVVDEGNLFRLQVVAHDPDTPPSPLVFSLESAPAGARMDSATGVITWLTTEADGPTNAIFVVTATEVNPPRQSTSRTFSVLVNEVNQPPVLLAFAPQTVREGDTLALRAQASDADLPPQMLTFSLDAGAPAGLTIDPASGWVIWAVNPDAGPSTNHVVVRVTDNGPGNLSATQMLTVVVVPQPHLVINEIMYRPATNRTEFIEIANNSAWQTVSLGGVRLVGSALAFEFPRGLRLDPGGFAVVARDRAAFTAAYGAGLPVVGEWAGTLNPAGDTLQLIRSAPPEPDAVINQVRFTAGPPWPAAASGQGGSLQLRDLQQDNSRVANWDAVAGLTSVQASTLLVMTNTWRYNQAGTDLGTAWRELAYDDSSWPAGPALLYVENAPLAAPKNTPLTIGQMQYYFRARFPYAGPTAGARLRARTFVDDGAVVYLNGREILRLGFAPETTVAFNLPSERLVGDATLEGPFEIPGDALRAGDNVVAVEVHQVNATSSDVVWGMDLVVEASATPATPGRANSLVRPLPPFPAVWLNELQPLNETGPLDNAGEREPWIELVNTGATAASLEGWYLTDSLANLTQWPFPTGFTLNGSSVRLLWADGEPGETTGTDVHTSFRLFNGRFLALVRDQPGGPAVVDFLLAPSLATDTSYGSRPDGQAFVRVVFDRPTPGAFNAVIPVPEILGIERTGDGGIRFLWATVPGVVYRVEAAPAVTGAEWQTVAEEVAAGEGMSYTDPVTAGRRFYRVVVP